MRPRLNGCTKTIQFQMLVQMHSEQSYIKSWKNYLWITKQTENIRAILWWIGQIFAATLSLFFYSDWKDGVDKNETGCIEITCETKRFSQSMLDKFVILLMFYGKYISKTHIFLPSPCTMYCRFKQFLRSHVVAYCMHDNPVHILCMSSVWFTLWTLNMERKKNQRESEKKQIHKHNLPLPKWTNYKWQTFFFFCVCHFQLLLSAIKTI